MRRFESSHPSHFRVFELSLFLQCPPQKGSVENAIGRLRPDLPRNTPLNRYADQDIEDIIMNYNDTPRKCLGFQSPFDAFIKDLLETVVLER